MAVFGRRKVAGMKTIRIVMMLGLCTVVPLAAAAQGIATSYQELRLLVRVGDKVTVTETSGQQVSGKITDLSAASLALMVDGRPRQWAETEVATISQRRSDSLANGAWIGLVSGAALPAIGLAIAVSQDDYDDDISGGEAAALIAVYAGLGAAVGVGIDALISRRQVIFERRTASGVTFAIAPLVGPTRAAARVSLGF
jgi:hypothetical protein